MKIYHKALTIAGSDSGAGAGIQADLKTFAALGCYGLSVLTAITAQNTLGVQAVHRLPPKFISQQLESVLTDIGCDAIKIGMLGDSLTVKTVSKQLQLLQSTPIIVDPVMVAKGGSLLLAQDAIITLRDELLPLATLLTPNLPEAECLLATKIDDLNGMEKAAQELCRLGPQAVLIKGGHLNNKEESSDYLFIQTTATGYWLSQTRIHTQNTHGTGCTLSAAIAALLAQKKPLVDAVKGAKRYVTDALQAGSQYQLGQGHGPVHHFYQNWT
jgi:hydroxymethylpyrimidine/phosphomethylpyrimidine kinase